MTVSEKDLTSPGGLAPWPGPEQSPVPILIVDDNDSKRLAIKSVLLPLGYDIVEASSGHDALRRVMERDFAVILLDVRMPVMDGFETAGLIRERRQSELTPIIFITSYRNDEILPIARYVEGAVDFLFAPVPPDELRAKVSVFVNQFVKAEQLAKSAEEVQTSADHLSLLTDAAPIGIFQTDAQNRYIYVNPRWSDVTGVAFEDALGKNWDTIFSDGGSPSLLVDLDPEAAYPANLRRRFEIKVPGEPSKVVLVTSEAISDSSGTVSGWVGTLADISAEAGAEAAREAAEATRGKLETQLHQAHKMEAVGQLAGGIAHDFNNILAVVLNYAEFVAETLPEEHAGQGDLQQIMKAADRGAELVQQLLAFSRQEVIQPSVIDLNEVISGMTVLLARSVGETIVLDIETAANVPFTKADHGQIEQILLNLVVNARDSMPHGGRIKIETCDVRLEIGTKLDLPPGRYARLTVTDTGSGIEPEVLEHIFEPFFTTKGRGEGTGLGLATVYGIVKQAEGGIYAESQMGVRTAFVIYLPATDEPMAEVVAPPIIGKSVDNATILVVEDEEPVRHLIGRILRRAGFEVMDVSSGAEALEICEASETRIDLLLTDVVMPSMSGPRLRDLVAPLRSDMAVLFMSGYTDELIAKNGVLDEGDALVSKPFDSARLLASVREALSSVVQPELGLSEKYGG